MTASTSPTRHVSHVLETFEFERLLREGDSSYSQSLVAYILGTACPSSSQQRAPAILKLEKRPFDARELEQVASLDNWKRLNAVLENDIYSTLVGQYAPVTWTEPNAQISTICPATEKHIRKYSKQVSRVVRETPQLFRDIIEPYIQSLPSSQVSWVYNILDGTKEADNVILRDEDPESGFVLTPDLKWDQKTMSALYLQVLVHTRQIRCLRDLRPCHLTLLHKIRQKCERRAMEKYGLDAGELRFFVHYQPTYYHFHVHVVHVDFLGFSGITVGQAHLLDDLIDTLELAQQGLLPEDVLAQRTFTYTLGVEHSLYKLMTDAKVSS
ncbi:hypothetical protein OIO90_001747 [Microbotryomycetes sp. JL221]|nr:hypothetical protein OIO90_001747 [Microbotryomycetes sp. JL221]